jgi:tRNA G18 (ribose-2'-O)-methylase SpoU
MWIERIADAADPRLEDYRDLRDGGHRRGPGVFIAEGRRLVRRLLAAPRFRTRSVLATETTLGGLSDVLGDGVPVYLAGDRIIRDVIGFDFHRGCLAAGERGQDASSTSLLAGRLLVVLERTTNPDNLGAVFRNALAFGADGVLLSPGSGDPLYRKAIRVSMGASLRVPFAELDDWPGGLAAFRAAGFTIVALVPEAPLDLHHFGAAPARTALLLGTEGEGLSAAARAAADVEVAIRMAPGDHSLNVATACGIALHHFARRGG